MQTGSQTRWQYGKTALECYRYMFDNEIATDVCFQVGTTEDTIVRIRAHKFTLISRSEVFDGMFSSGMIETQGAPDATIRIEDIEPDTFKEMLRFIYSDSADVNATTALDLLYAARKYLLPNLVQQCCECLLKRLSAKNVCSILNQRLLISEGSDLAQKCIEFIEHNATEVLKPEQLQYASRQTIETILQMDSLHEEETVIYNACIDWAKAQLKNHQSIDHPNDQQIREMLGDLIYDIRFATMDGTAFCELTESGTVLSAEEHSDILGYILRKQKPDTMKFNCQKRFWQRTSFDDIKVIDRGGSVGIKTDSWKSGHDAIDVTTSQTILVTGLGLLPEKGRNGSGYTVDLEILMSTIPIFKMSSFVPFTGDSTPHEVRLTSPVPMKDGIVYTIIAKSCDGKTLHYRIACQPICQASNVTFMFYKTACTTRNCTSMKRGQIPQIYFKVPK